MALITVSELKNILSITGSDKDTELGYAVDAAIDYVERVTRTTWDGTKTATDEVHDRAPVIFTNKIGIQSITTIKSGYGDDFDTVSSDNYRFNEYGRVMLSFDQDDPITHYDFDEIRITYVYGYSAVPDDLKQAALLLAAMAYNMGPSYGMQISREKVGSREVEYSSGEMNVFDVINSYGF